jgi:hypothetical protein
MNNSVLKNIKAIILGLIMVLGLNFALATWTDPQCTPPNCNLDAPINASSASQARTAPFLVGGSSLPASGFNFSAIGGPSFIEGVVTSQLTFADSNTVRANKVLNTLRIYSVCSPKSIFITLPLPLSINCLLISDVHRLTLSR